MSWPFNIDIFPNLDLIKNSLTMILMGGIEACVTWDWGSYVTPGKEHYYPLWLHKRRTTSSSHVFGSMRWVGRQIHHTSMNNNTNSFLYLIYSKTNLACHVREHSIITSRLGGGVGGLSIFRDAAWRKKRGVVLFSQRDVTISELLTSFFQK